MDTHTQSSMYRWVVSGIALVILKIVADRALSLRRTFVKIKEYPGRVPLWIDPFGAIGLAAAPVYPRPGMAGHYLAGFSLYNKFGATSFVSVNVPTALQRFWFADPEAIKTIVSDRRTFQKDAAQYEVINIYGGNVVGLEGADWKRHRSVTMSAFSEANIALVWSETIRVVNEWFQQLDADGPNITMDMSRSMSEVTLLVISSAGFGKMLSLTTDSREEPPPGCKLPFQTAVTDSVTNVVFKAIIPKWFYQLSSLIRVPYLSSRALLTQLAFDDLQNHMLDLVSSACAEIISGERSKASSAALLRNLVEANMNQDRDSKRLTDGELLSNIFAFLLAGRDSSAHALSLACVLLALNPNYQQRLHEEVIRVWSTDAPDTQLMTNFKEHLDKLEYTVACIRETLRLFPAAPRIPRNVQVDTVLPGTYFTPGSKDSPSVETGKFSMTVPKGSIVVLDIMAMHLNPLDWGEDAGEFKPERFVDTEFHQWPRHAYLPFSGGPRSCMGQQFAIVQMVGILASVVRRYQILVPDDLAKKSPQEQKKTLLAWTTGISLTPLNARVKLCRRV